MNQEYTNLFLQDFSQQDVLKYNNKFKSRWEKNIKHREQVNLVKKYLNDTLFWCDCPIGSGRLMDEIKTLHMYGIDKSPAFLEYNRKKNITCFENDLFHLNINMKFDIVTCFHTIFAFDDFKIIIKNLFSLLKPNGILIIDFVNQDHLEKTKNLPAYPYKSGVSINDIKKIAQNNSAEIVELFPHDFWDNRYISYWFEESFKKHRKLGKKLWYIVNFFYFRFNLFPFFHFVEKSIPAKYFVKYLVVLRKNNEPEIGDVV